MKSAQIRQTFLDFFKEKQHEVVSSAPMVIKNDPTLMFTNAGMNQFKDLFLGNSEIKYARIADSQKCLRVSGKHNDLEEVGVDTYHHTMFEMLGNWSFGNYFKKEAIEWAWELLVDVYKIDKDRLYFTVFEGDEQDGTEMDEDAYNLWKAILEKNNLPLYKILKANKKDNFWEMGDTGPCGPCSEIHVDLRNDDEIAKIPGRELVNADHPQVVEIWNLVFMEFNRMANGELKSLPAKHVDTGMGFERLAMVLQGKQSNYDTDVFMPTIDKISQLTGVKYQNTLDVSVKTDVAIRVIADHVRAVTFSIADGQLPSNTGAGYVIRRILRRAIRYGYSFLDQKEPFINELVSVLAKQMGEAFPELLAQQELITKVIREEEDSFLRTLEKGIHRFENYLATANDKTVDGEFAFELYDTFGFPIDLTELMATENNFDVDMPGFIVALDKQKERSRAAGKIEADDWVVLREDDVEEFIGYDYTEADTYLTKYRRIVAKGEEFYQLVFRLTPFYPEGGGQVGDTGYIDNGFEKVEILDTKKENNLIIHFVKELPKDYYTKFKIVVSNDRNLTACNHSATHLMHQALREILGTHVEQKGSLVNAEYLRFDFSHFEKLNDEQLQQIEDFVNEKIQANIPLNEHREIPITKAEEAGAMMLFGEKYGDVVRMIEFGDSKELCGGIHVDNTSEIKLFKIKSEGSVAAGIRRIEALTNIGAGNWLKEKVDIIAENNLTGLIPLEIKNQVEEFKNNLMDECLKVSNDCKDIDLKSPGVSQLDAITNAINEFTKIKLPQNIIEGLNTKKKEILKAAEEGNKEKASQIKDELLGKVEVVNGVNVIAQKIDLDDSAAIKDLAFQLKGQIDNLFMVLGAEVNGKPNLTIVVSEELSKTKNLHAGNIIREAAKEMRGGGGGQPFYATAGGSNVEGIQAAIAKALSFIA
ncbi:alanine--tRNA ligase [Vicingus serpentipes]|uniref:Alanine--tRNA ligase n=1 Tax=Vicingus serpentipes TaxID=1926625 RepID=A0A5C6RTA6_9FLAO|nr:alanine--tRNA ligase [Vicingus serpentipes]TXB65184.1 alanine--tRNA ligase [Vicingus serpentipes]